MPSVPFDLGKYVTLRHRKDGTARVFFQVPERLRPSDWPSLIPLPHQERRGDLKDASEVQRIQQDAAALYDRLQAARAGREVKVFRRDLPTLNRLWQQSQHFTSKRPATQRGYAYHASLLLTWSELLKDPLVAEIGHDRIEKLLAAYDDRPSVKRYLKAVLQMLLNHAEALGWITTNPAKRFRVKTPKTKVTIWEAEDVEFYANAAEAHGQPTLAAMIRVQYEIGQRLTDVRHFMYGRHYQDGRFRFEQSKTDSPIDLNVSPALARLLADLRDPDSLYLLRNSTTGRPFEENELSLEFRRLRKISKGKHLTLRALRHSCVVRLARAECTVPEIATITGHAIASAEQILAVYLPRDNELARSAERKRDKKANGKGTTV
jgi:hypothetical protein